MNQREQFEREHDQNLREVDRAIGQMESAMTPHYVCCSVGHTVPDIEFERTRYRLPCGCPLTVERARQYAKVSKERAEKLLAEERAQTITVDACD